MTREEALKIVRENYPHFGTTEPWLDLEKALATLIPELRESEDERIRKEIIKYIQDFCNPCDPDCDKWIAYLEKQKYDRMQPIYDSIDSFESALDKAWKAYNDSGARTVDGCEDDYVECAHAKGFREGFLYGLEKQKENPKSADSIPSDCVSDAKCEDKSPKHSDSDGTDIRDTPAYWKGWDDAMKQKEQKHPNGCFTCDEYKKGYEAGRLNGFTAGYNKVMKEVDQKEQKPVDLSEMMVHKEPYIAPVPTPMVADEQKPAEWSEEDEKTISDACCWIAEYAGYLMGKNYGKASMLMGLVDRLKSLRPQPKQNVNNMITPNKKFFQWIYDRLVNVHKENPDVDYMISFKRRIEELSFDKPSWKPSEEQMDSLRDTIVQTKGYSYSMYLPELYEQLKKLM